MVDKQPEGYHTINTSLVVDGAGELLDFVANVFGANERMRMPRPDGKIMHSEVQIGDSVIMIGDANPPEYDAGRAWIQIYVDDVDATFARAIAAGATAVEQPTDMFYGDRTGTVIDKWQTRWSIATHVEDVSDEEIDRRMAALFGDGGS